MRVPPQKPNSAGNYNQCQQPEKSAAAASVSADVKLFEFSFARHVII
jgi:hypothetical protein